MIKILANDGIHPEGKKLLEAAGFQVDVQKIAQEELMAKLPAYDAIIVRSATRVRQDLIDACPRLKIIARGGVGLDNIDLDYAEQKGIAVFNTPAASSRAVAELVFAHAFSLARMLHQSNRDMPIKGATEFKTLKNNFSKGFQLSGKTLGIIGFGRIGQEVAKIGIGMGMRIVATDPYIKEAKISLGALGYEDNRITVTIHTSGMDEVLQNADILTLHVPFLGKKPIIGAEELDKMKNGAMLINTSRGGVVDETALILALDSGKLAGAGLDVFKNEPTPDTSILQHSNISLSPHSGAETQEAQVNIGIELAEQIIAFFASEKH